MQRAPRSQGGAFGMDVILGNRSQADGNSKTPTRSEQGQSEALASLRLHFAFPEMLFSNLGDY